MLTSDDCKTGGPNVVGILNWRAKFRNRTFSPGRSRQCQFLNQRLPAEKVHFSFDKSVENMWTRRIEEISLFKNGIEMLMPDKQYVVSLGPSQLFLNKVGVGWIKRSGSTIPQ